jgi:hypothetical protein
MDNGESMRGVSSRSASEDQSILPKDPSQRQQLLELLDALLTESSASESAVQANGIDAHDADRAPLRSLKLVAFVSATATGDTEQLEFLRSRYLGGLEGHQIVSPVRHLPNSSISSVADEMSDSFTVGHANLTHCLIRCENNRRLTELTRVLHAAQGSGSAIVFVDSAHHAQACVIQFAFIHCRNGHD